MSMAAGAVVQQQAVCEKHGSFEQQLFKLGDRVVQRSHCPKCESERQQAERAEKQAKQQRINQLYVAHALKALNIPRRYQAASLEAYRPTCPEAEKAKRWVGAYMERFDNVLKKGISLVMCGKPGTGKTHLATAIARHVVAHYQAVLAPITVDDWAAKNLPQPVAQMLTTLDILRAVKATYGGEGSERDVIARFASVPLLIIDEVGVHYGTDADKIILFDLLNRRYEDMLPTVLISNLPADELGEFIGERVLDRLREGGGAVIDFTWDSYRGARS